ncbi:hypothetical protein CPB86DRAFT_870713 [Serendipita vermifera]|nr:hypothetical protein CPB86DRAFT_870713 [Serendipita vermifera]
MEQRAIKDHTGPASTSATDMDSPLIPSEGQGSHETGILSPIVPIRLPWDVLPFAEEVVIIDPTKAYFSALPIELKMGILDHFCQRYTGDFGPQSTRSGKCVITPNSEDVYSLKSIRLCNREFARLGSRCLFRMVNLTPCQKSITNWLTRFTEAMFPQFGPFIHYATVFLDDEDDATIARILPQLTSLQWIVLDLHTSFPSAATTRTLGAFSSLTRLTICYSNYHSLNCFEGLPIMLQASGSHLKSLELIYMAGSRPRDIVFHTIRDHVTSLDHLYIACTSHSMLDRFLTEEPEWPSRMTLKDVKFEECQELDAWIIADIVRLFPALTHVNICSCGGPGDYGNALNEGVSQKRVRVMQNLKPVPRQPLESLRIVHATDVEFRYMCRIPTKKLIVYDPLDQLLLGELLSQKDCFPFMTTFELQYVLEEGEANAALNSIKNAIALRGGCTFLDTRDKHLPPRRGFW